MLKARRRQEGMSRGDLIWGKEGDAVPKKYSDAPPSSDSPPFEQFFQPSDGRQVTL